MSEERLIDLETKYSYHEILIEELRQITHDQYLRIEKLEKQLEQLIAELKNAGLESIRPSEKPPHY